MAMQVWSPLYVRPLREAKTIDEMERWAGKGWKLEHPETALHERDRPDGIIAFVPK